MVLIKGIKLKISITWIIFIGCCIKKGTHLFYPLVYTILNNI